jgi:hypothetical protein
VLTLLPSSVSLAGSWHVEGMPHEHIVASAICYLSSSDNIECNYLEFRSLLSEENFYDNHGRAGDEVDLIHELGEVDTPTGRILVWKNDLQHKVGPLSVSTPEDEEEEQRAKKTRKRNKASDSSGAAAMASSLPVPPSGVRKILCFFLVSPEHRVVSTKIVPPQQALIPLEVAMEHRQALMNERKYFARRDAEDWEARTYTFCEH